MRAHRTTAVAFALTLLSVAQAQPLSAQDDVAAIVSEEIELPHRKGTSKEATKRTYFFIGPKTGAEAPKRGYALLLVLPGGAGGRDFHPFVKRIYQNAVGDDWVAAQLVSVPWARSKQLVWPTVRNAPKGRGLETELFIEDVVTDVARRAPLDPRRVFVVAWSSSGPAAYATSLQKRKSVTGFYIAMSVFKPQQLPPLKEARREAYFLLHSPQDQVCPHRMAIDAETRLTKAGARVQLRNYEGGHGWRGNVYGNLREGLGWLDENRSPPDRSVWPRRRLRPAAKN